MSFDGQLWVGTWATVVLWVTSGALAVILGLLLAAGSVDVRPWFRLPARVAVNITRGVPTSLMVIAAGIGVMRVSRLPRIPAVFPGTLPAFQPLAWGVALALGLGSAGHLAEIFRAARSALGRSRLEQSMVLGLSRLGRARLLGRECAAIALPPTGTRLVHHLHNTAFAALFPVTDLFGSIFGLASATFDVFYFALFGCVIYVMLSGLTWLLFRIAETALAPATAQPQLRRRLAWS